MNRRVLLALPAIFYPALALSQARPICIVVPFPPGGAGGNIAAEVVARATPDSATLFPGSATIFCANRYLYRGAMPFDTLRDFAHVSRVSVGTTLLATRADRPWESDVGLVAAAKQAPGRLTAGNSGWGTIRNLTIAKFCKVAGIEVSQVPYRGLAPGLNDLIAGNLDLIFDGMPAIVPHVREGRLRALAVGSADRVTYVPGIETVPSMTELAPGSGMDMAFWYCISTPAATPGEVVDRLHQAVVGAARTRTYADKLLPLGFAAIMDDSPAGFTEFIRAQDAVWKDLVELYGVRLE